MNKVLCDLNNRKRKKHCWQQQQAFGAMVADGYRLNRFAIIELYIKSTNE